MVIYLDQVWLLNSLADALALYLTARFSALPLRCARLIPISVLGGIYGVVITILPVGNFVAVVSQFCMAALLVRLAFGASRYFLRIFLLFYLLSYTLAGTFLSLTQQIHVGSGEFSLENLNWEVFLLASAICYFLISVSFHGNAKHVIRGEIVEVKLFSDGNTIAFDALLDTGHTLLDPYNGKPVLTVWHHALPQLLGEEERRILDNWEAENALRSIEYLNTLVPGKYRLIPYRAVGISCAFLPSVKVDRAKIGKETIRNLTVLLSPSILSDGGGYSALWGGKGQEGGHHAASSQVIHTADLTAIGTDSPR